VRLADQTTLLPGGASPFNFYALSAFDGGVSFISSGNANSVRGVYTYTGSINRIADNSTLVPAGTGTFNDFTRTVSDGDTIVFIGYDRTGVGGIYARYRGNLLRIVDQNQELEAGKFTGTFDIGPQGLSGNTLIFSVTFLGGSMSIYSVDLAQLFSQP
jgi:hypothetical protein